MTDEDARDPPDTDPPAAGDGSTADEEPPEGDAPSDEEGSLGATFDGATSPTDDGEGSHSHDAGDETSGADRADGSGEAAEDGAGTGAEAKPSPEAEPSPDAEAAAETETATDAVDSDADTPSSGTATTGDGGTAAGTATGTATGDRSVVSALAVDPGAWAENLRDRFRHSRAFRVVTVVAAFALLVRLVGLGWRVAHWDEGRVAYWILRYQETGVWHYRPSVHGPFLFHVDKYLFTIFGASDFVARLPVALLGGLLPLSAWLLRDYLRDSEVVALAGLLALNPLVFYYSRFMRNDVLVAGFMLFALGFFARAYATRRPAYLYAGVVSLALGFTTKENALLYVLCWLGAMGLLFDHRMIGAVTRDGALTGDSLRTWPFERSPREVGGLLLVAVANPLAVGVAGMVAGVVPVGLAAFGAGLLAAAGGTALAIDRSPYHLVGPAVVVLASLGAVLAGGERAMFLFSMGWFLVAMLAADGFLFGGRSATADAGDGDDQGDADLFAPGWQRHVPPMLVAYVLLFGTLVFFYAPRGGAVDGLGLWRAFLHPTQFPALIEEALLGSAKDLVSVWVNTGSHKLESYPGNLQEFFWTMVNTAGVVLAFSGLGFVLDRWSPDGPRDLVAMGFYWGVVSILGYPYATDIWAPWITVHAIVPLAIPAAVGVGAIIRSGADFAYEGDEIGTAVAAVLLVILAIPAGIMVVDVGYLGSDTHQRIISPGEERRTQRVMQWAQPENDMKETLATVEAISRANDDGADVMFYTNVHPDTGATLFYVPNESVCLDTAPVHEPRASCQDPDLNWHSRLPLPWYLEMYGAETTSPPPANNTEALQEDVPPVVVAYAWDREEVSRELPGRYEPHQYRFKLWAEDVVIFVDTSAVPGDG